MNLNLKIATFSIVIISIFVFFSSVALGDENNKCDKIQTLPPAHIKIFKTLPGHEMLDALERMDYFSAATLAIDNLSTDKFKEVLLLKYTRALNSVANTYYRKQLINELKDSLVMADLDAIKNGEEEHENRRDLTDRLIKEFGLKYYQGHLRGLGYNLICHS